MLEENNNIRLSILVPVYKRYGRFYRGLLYLSEIIKNNDYRNLFKGVEIIIADGTEQEGQKNFHQKSQQLALRSLDKLKKNISIQYTLLPGTSYLERLVWLSKQAKGEYVTMQGDEDVIAFDSVENWLDELDNNPKISAITGQYLDCKGFQRLGSTLKFHLEEGWVYGVDIDQDCPKARILQFRVLSVGGISSISYSIMRHSVFKNFTSALEKNYDRYTYIAMENMLNLFQLAAGEIKIKSMPYMLRDFTFIDHSSIDQEAYWSDSAKDKESFLLSLYSVNDVYPLFSSEEEASMLFDTFMQISKFGSPLRKELHRVILSSAQSGLVREVKQKIKPPTMKALVRSWKSTAELCYSKKDLRSIGLLSCRALLQAMTRKFFGIFDV